MIFWAVRAGNFMREMLSIIIPLRQMILKVGINGIKKNGKYGKIREFLKFKGKLEIFKFKGKFLFYRRKTINRKFQKQPINRPSEPRVQTSIFPSETFIAHQIHLRE
jgi:hypothetical protein